MAEVFLTREETKGDLPALCMCCGAEAKTCVTRKFIVVQPRVGGGFAEIVAIQAIIGFANAPRLRLPTTFCGQHRYYWHLRDGLRWGGLAGSITLIIGGVIMAISVFISTKTETHWPDGCLLLSLFVCMIAWGIPMARFARNPLRATRYGDGRILLQNVGEKYVAGLLAQREP